MNCNAITCYCWYTNSMNTKIRCDICFLTEEVRSQLGRLMQPWHFSTCRTMLYILECSIKLFQTFRTFLWHYSPAIDYPKSTLLGLFSSTPSALPHKIAKAALFKSSTETTNQKASLRSAHEHQNNNNNRTP